MSLVHSASGLAEDRPLGRSSFDPKCGKALTLLRRAAGSNPARSTTNNIQRRETRVGPRALMKIHGTDSLLVSGRDPYCLNNSSGTGLETVSQPVSGRFQELLLVLVH